MNKKKSPALAGKPGFQVTSPPNHTKAITKWRRVLKALLDGRSFNRFEAERELHDHCLHSTIATIQGKGVPIDRRDEVVPGYQGILTHVCRYWLAAEHAPKALELIGGTSHSPVALSLEEARP